MRRNQAHYQFQAAVAHYRSTGKRTLLDVALKSADHIDTIFGPGMNDYPLPDAADLRATFQPKLLGGWLKRT